MDILDPLDTSDGEIMEAKVINIKNSMESDDEQNVEHLSPQTLLETPEPEVQYSLRSPEGSMITYRVLQVEDGTDSSPPQLITTTAQNFSSSAVPQVLTNNLNGQIYVIGNPGDVFTSQSAAARAIAPRSTDSPVVVQVKKRDERRRATHNEVERRRRDKINNWITKLSKIIPENSHDMKTGGQYDGHSKGGILAKAFEYILELQNTEKGLESCLKENKKLSHTVEMLKQKNFNLERENKELRDLLKRNGVEMSNS